MSTVTDVITILETVTGDVLQAMQQTELASLLQAAEKLAGDVAAAIQARTPNLPVEVATADITADIVEDQKFPKP